MRGSRASYRMKGGHQVLSDKKITELNRKARGEGYDRHTHRFQQSRRYCDTFDSNNIPEWLKWRDGTWAPLDGSDSRERHQ